MSTFKVGNKVRQIKFKKPYQGVEGLVGSVTEIDADNTFDILVAFPGLGVEFPFASVELELVHE